MSYLEQTSQRQHASFGRQSGAGYAFVSFIRNQISVLRDDYLQHRRLRMDRDAFLNVLTLEDRQLDDMGVTRADAEWAARLPLERNAAQALHALRSSRSR